MRVRNVLMLAAILLFLAGCATTKSGVEKTYDMSIKNSGQGIVYLNVVLDADTQTKTASGDAGAGTEVDPAVALGMQGSTASAAAKGAEQVLKDILSYAEQWMQDNRKEEVVVPPTPAPVVTPPPVEEPPVVTPPVNTGEAEEHTLKYDKLTNGDRPTYYTYNSASLKVGDTVRMVVGEVTEECTVKVRDNGSIGCDWPDGTVIKNSSISGRGIAVLLPVSSVADPGPPGTIYINSKLDDY